MAALPSKSRIFGGRTLVSALSLALMMLVASGCGEAPRVPSKDAGVAGTPGGLRRAPKIEGAERAGLGEPRTGLSFADVDGKELTLASAADGKPLVIFVRDRDCPVCRKYGRILADLEKKWSAQGVQFLYLNPSRVDSTEYVKEDRDTFGFKGPYVHDQEGRLALALRATSTADSFLFDAEGVLRYRGAVDDRIGIGYTREVARANYLEDALRTMLAGRRPRPDATTAPGCFLDLEEAVAGVESPLFHRDIVPIFQRSCQSCHRPGETGPFSLISYKDVKGHAGIVRFVLENGSMPPWYADAHVGGPWQNDLSMPEEDVKTVFRWLDAGAPEGDPADAPPPLPRDVSHLIQDPDLIIEAGQKWAVPPEGLYQYKHALVDPGLKEDRWVERLELRSKHMDAVHHIVIFEVPEGTKVPTGIALHYLALEGFYGIYFPGCEVLEYPDSTGRLMPKGSKFLFQVHYNGNGRHIIDEVEARIVFAKEKPTQRLRCDAANCVKLDIAPGQADFRAYGDFVMPEAGKIYSFLPHMHTRGKACVIKLIYPDGRIDKVLSVSNYDFNWQQIYRLETPKSVPKGTIVRMEGVFDNSADNPANPDPTTWVSFGLRTQDEMLVGYFEWVADAETR